jgi:hypothetical protein
MTRKSVRHFVICEPTKASSASISVQRSALCWLAPPGTRRRCKSARRIASPCTPLDHRGEAGNGGQRLAAAASTRQRPKTGRDFRRPRGCPSSTSRPPGPHRARNPLGRRASPNTLSDAAHDSRVAQAALARLRRQRQVARGARFWRARSRTTDGIWCEFHMIRDRRRLFLHTPRKVIFQPSG